MGARFGLIATGLAQTQEQIDNAPPLLRGDIKLGDLLYQDTNGDGKIMDKGSGVRLRPHRLWFAPRNHFLDEHGLQLQELTSTCCGRALPMSITSCNGIWGYKSLRPYSLHRPFYNDGKHLSILSKTPGHPKTPTPAILVCLRLPVRTTLSLLHGGLSTANISASKNLTIGYDVPESVLKHTPFSRFNIYVVGYKRSYLQPLQIP